LPLAGGVFELSNWLSFHFHWRRVVGSFEVFIIATPAGTLLIVGLFKLFRVREIDPLLHRLSDRLLKLSPPRVTGDS
jgi:hypothetical protein